MRKLAPGAGPGPVEVATPGAPVGQGRSSWSADVPFRYRHRRDPEEGEGTVDLADGGGAAGLGGDDHGLSEIDWADVGEMLGLESLTRTRTAGLRIRNEVSGHSHGQTDGTLLAYDGDKVVGYVDWTKFQGEVSIRMIEVSPESRRQGVGTQLMQALREEFGQTPIVQGDTVTDDGLAFLTKTSPESLNKSEPESKEMACACDQPGCPECGPRLEKEAIAPPNDPRDRYREKRIPEMLQLRFPHGAPPGGLGQAHLEQQARQDEAEYWAQQAEELGIDPESDEAKVPGRRRRKRAAEEEPDKSDLPRYDFAGFDIVVEHPAGSKRSWGNPDGPADQHGETDTLYDYGFLDGYIGSDKEEVDVYVGPDEDADFVYVVHQNKKPDFDQYDEDKCLLGFSSADEAKDAYLAHYNDDRFFGGMSTFHVEDFRNRLEELKQNRDGNAILGFGDTMSNKIASDENYDRFDAASDADFEARQERAQAIAQDEIENDPSFGELIGQKDLGSDDSIQFRRVEISGVELFYWVALDETGKPIHQWDWCDESEVERGGLPEGSDGNDKTGTRHAAALRLCRRAVKIASDMNLAVPNVIQWLKMETQQAEQAYQAGDPQALDKLKELRVKLDEVLSQAGIKTGAASWAQLEKRASAQNDAALRAGNTKTLRSPATQAVTTDGIRNQIVAAVRSEASRDRRPGSLLSRSVEADLDQHFDRYVTARGDEAGSWLKRERGPVLDFRDVKAAVKTALQDEDLRESLKDRYWNEFIFRIEANNNPQQNVEELPATLLHEVLYDLERVDEKRELTVGEESSKGLVEQEFERRKIEPLEEEEPKEKKATRDDSPYYEPMIDDDIHRGSECQNCGSPDANRHGGPYSDRDYDTSPLCDECYTKIKSWDKDGAVQDVTATVEQALGTAAVTTKTAAALKSTYSMQMAELPTGISQIKEADSGPELPIDLFDEAVYDQRERTVAALTVSRMAEARPRMLGRPDLLINEAVKKFAKMVRAFKGYTIEDRSLAKIESTEVAPDGSVTVGALIWNIRLADHAGRRRLGFTIVQPVIAGQPSDTFEIVTAAGKKVALDKVALDRLLGIRRDDKRVSRGNSGVEISHIEES